MDNLQSTGRTPPIEKTAWKGFEDLSGVGTALLSGEPLLLRLILEKEEMRMTDIPLEKLKRFQEWVDHTVIGFLVGEGAYADVDKWKELSVFTRWTVQSLRSFGGAVIDPFITIAWLFKMARGSFDGSWSTAFQQTISTEKGWAELGKELANGIFELGCSMIGSGIACGLLVGMGHVLPIMKIVAIVTGAVFLGISYYNAIDSIDVKIFSTKSQELLSLGISCAAVGMIAGVIATYVAPLVRADAGSLAFLVPAPNTLAFRGTKDAPWPELFDKAKFMTVPLDLDAEELSELTHRKTHLIEEIKKIKNVSLSRGGSYPSLSADVTQKQWLYNKKIQLLEVKKRIKELQNTYE